MITNRHITAWTKYWSFVGRLFTNLFVNIYTFCLRTNSIHSEVVSDDQISLQAEYICQKYIECKISRNGKTKSLKVVQLFRAEAGSKEICSEEVVRTMQRFGEILENGFPKLYSNVIQQLNFGINFDIVICGVFTCVCDNILASGITWAKIVSMYAFAAALAIDCCQAKDVKTARNISRWMRQYTHKRLCWWIRDHGGWGGFAVHFDSSSCIFSSGGKIKCKWINRVALILTMSIIACIFMAVAAYKLR